jgi:hypothetical protein
MVPDRSLFLLVGLGRGGWHSELIVPTTVPSPAKEGRRASAVLFFPTQFGTKLVTFVHVAYTLRVAQPKTPQNADSRR